MVKTISERKRIWDKVLSKVETQLQDRHIFDSFFSTTSIHSIEGDTIIVSVNSRLAANILNQRYAGFVQEIIEETTQSNFKINFVHEEDLKTTKEESSVSTEKSKFFSK